jgi:hypothetical protein
VVEGKVLTAQLQVQQAGMEVLQPLVAMVLVVVLMELVLPVQLTQVVEVVEVVALALVLVRLVVALVHIVKNLSIHHLPHMLMLLAQVEVAVRQEQADSLAVLVARV